MTCKSDVKIQIPDIINKAILERSYTHSLLYHLQHFPTTTTELSSCSRDLLACKAIKYLLSGP